jgi:MinD-like ATPase involved in chromosome partitioning or flagellar assembly
VNILLNIAPRFTLEQVLDGSRNILEILVTGPGGITIVPAASGIAEFANLTVVQQKLLLQAMRTLEAQFDYLIIDTHPGLNEETLLSITISDILLLILRPDRQDFQGTAVTVDIARKLGVPALYLVVNKVPRGVDTADLREQMTAAYAAETAAILPLAEEVVQNASAGLFSLTTPDHPWSEQVRIIAERVSS